MEASSPPSTPVSFKSTYSSPSALESSPNALQDIKRPDDDDRHSPKMDQGSPSSLASGGNAGSGAKAQVYAGVGGVSGGAEGERGGVVVEGMTLKQAVISEIRKVEYNLGAPALVRGIPLVAVMEREGIMMDSYQVPVVHTTAPDDLANASPRHAAPARPPTLQELRDERKPEGDFGRMSRPGFAGELQRISVPGFEVGRRTRVEELIEREEERLIKKHLARQALHDQTWEHFVAEGKKWVDEHQPAPAIESDDDEDLPFPAVPLPLPAVNNPEPAVTSAGQAEEHAQPGGHAPEGEPKVPVVKKIFGKIAKLGGKLAKDVAEDAIEHAIENAMDNAMGVSGA